MAFIELHDIEKEYISTGERVSALRGVSLQVSEGEFLGVMGASGSGKSTLLSIVGGLLKPSSGSLLIDGINLYELPSERRADFRREYLGFVFQAFNLIPYLTALENVMLPLTVKQISSKEKRSLAQDALAAVGLAERQGHLPSQLSGGEQERVAVARAIVNRPPLLLADEPTGSLDSATGQEILGLLQELNSKGQTIVMVTHNEEYRSCFDRIVTLKDGTVAWDTLADQSEKVAL